MLYVVMDALKLLPKLTRKAGKGSPKRSLRKRLSPITITPASTVFLPPSGITTPSTTATTVTTEDTGVLSKMDEECATVKSHAPVSIMTLPSPAARPTDSYCLIPKSQHLPFQHLPDVCKLKVFSYLSVVDKGRSAQVCRSWNAYFNLSSVWDTVDLASDFNYGCLPSADHSVTGKECHQCYCERIQHFLIYLSRIQPVMRRLDFCFDIGETDTINHYLDTMQQGLPQPMCKHLRYVRVNWKELQDRWLDPRNQPCQDAVYADRLRLRRFTFFFDYFTSIAPSITTLILPFDWNQKSVECLTRLKDLQSLVLKRVCLDAVEQNHLDIVLSQLTSLKRLLLEVWLPSGCGLIPYKLQSQSLEHLDISESHGLYLSQLDMPRLKGVRIARHILLGPLKNFDKLNLPCLHRVLSNGAPNLLKINDHYLQDNWRKEIYPTLEEVLRAVCSCRCHLTELAV